MTNPNAVGLVMCPKCSEFVAGHLINQHDNICLASPPSLKTPESPTSPEAPDSPPSSTTPESPEFPKFPPGYVESLGPKLLAASRSARETDEINELMEEINNPTSEESVKAAINTVLNMFFAMALRITRPADAADYFQTEGSDEEIQVADKAKKVAKPVDSVNVEDMTEITAVVIGHTDSGKSTFSAGLTLDAQGFFICTKHKLRVIDAPGQLDDIETMVNGTCQADLAVLVVDSTSDVFNGHINNEMRLHEHAFMAFTLGVKQMICCVNKMDATTPEYSQDRYAEVQQGLSSYLADVGYNTTRMHFIPISSVKGDNMIERSTNLGWYKGPTVLEALNNVKNPMKDFQPLRLPIQKVINDRDGNFLEGRLVSGKLHEGMQITVGPMGVQTKPLSVSIMGSDHGEVHERGHGVSSALRAGQRASVELRTDVGSFDLQTGHVVSNSKENPAKEALSFKAHVSVINSSGPIRPGYSGILFCHSARVQVTFSKLASKVDRVSGKTIDLHPDFLQDGDTGLVEITPSHPVVVEMLSAYPSMGRFYVKEGDTVTAIGVVISVVQKDYPNVKGKSGYSSRKKKKK